MGKMIMKLSIKLRKYSNLWFSLVALAIFSYDFTLGMLIPVVPLFLQKLGLSDKWLGVPLMVFGIGWSIGSVAFAKLMYRYNERKLFLVVAYVILVVYGLNLMFLKNLVQFVIILFLQGLGQGIVWQLGLLIVSELFSEKHQAIANGYLFAAYNLSTILSPVISSFVFHMFGSLGNGIVIAVLGSIGFLISIVSHQNLDNHVVVHPKKITWQQIRHPAFAACMVLAICSAALNASLESIISLILEFRFDISEKFIGSYFLCISIPATVASLIMGHMSAKVSEYYILWLGIFLSLISTFIIMFSYSLVFTGVGLACLGFGFIFMASPVPSFLSDVLMVHPSALHAAFNFCTASGIAVYPFVSGIILDESGVAWTAVFLIASILATIPLMMMAFHSQLSRVKSAEADDSLLARSTSIKTKRYSKDSFLF